MAWPRQENQIKCCTSPATWQQRQMGFCTASDQDLYFQDWSSYSKMSDRSFKCAFSTPSVYWSGNSRLSTDWVTLEQWNSQRQRNLQKFSSEAEKSLQSRRNKQQAHPKRAYTHYCNSLQESLQPQELQNSTQQNSVMIHFRRGNVWREYKQLKT
jgi:hypothetical protein